MTPTRSMAQMPAPSQPIASICPSASRPRSPLRSTSPPNRLETLAMKLGTLAMVSDGSRLPHLSRFSCLRSGCPKATTRQSTSRAFEPRRRNHRGKSWQSPPFRYSHVAILGNPHPFWNALSGMTCVWGAGVMQGKSAVYSKEGYWPCKCTNQLPHIMPDKCIPVANRDRCPHESLPCAHTHIPRPHPPSLPQLQTLRKSRPATSEMLHT